LKQLANVPTYIDDPLTWSTISTWLDNCSSTAEGTGQAGYVLRGTKAYDPEIWLGYSKEHHPVHHKCHTAIMEKILPSRLIDVAEHEESIRIVDTKDLTNSNDIQYATLSHCWGPPDLLPTRTLKANVESKPYDISFDTVSKTFQHAITATRKLGMRYLWIDSLCIVQDDASDWNRESKIMGNIYANGHINIVASDAADSSVGLFFNRPQPNDFGFRTAVSSIDQARIRHEATEHTHPQGLPLLPVYSISNPISDIRASATQDLDAIFTCAVSMSNSSRLTSKRAWCFQETFLAPRSLFFTQQQVYFECRHLRASQSVPTGFSHGDDEGSRFDVSRETQHLRQLVEWYGIVQEYSRRDLTYWRDRLPALSGIARAMYHKNPDVADRKYTGKARQEGPNYLAGLWNSYELEKQLYWFRASNPEARPQPLHMPSWSWASARGDISLIQGWHAMSGITLHVIRADIESETDDEFGVCRGGRLEVGCRGPFAAEVREDGEFRYLRINGAEYKEVRVYLDEPLGRPDVFGVHGIYEDEPTGPVQDAGLLLQPVEGSKDTYRRVGIFIVHEKDWRVNSFEWGCKLKNLILPTNSDVRICIV
jgi:hypothetical protein